MNLCFLSRGAGDDLCPMPLDMLDLSILGVALVRLIQILCSEKSFVVNSAPVPRFLCKRQQPRCWTVHGVVGGGKGLDDRLHGRIAWSIMVTTGPLTTAPALTVASVPGDQLMEKLRAPAKRSATSSQWTMFHRAAT